MALPTSGPLALTDIQTEFGGSNPISLNEYYAGGLYVPAGTSGTYGAVPSSGQISIQNFYGTSNVPTGIGRGVYAGGQTAGEAVQNVIQYITIATTGNTTDFGDLSISRGSPPGVASATRGVFAGGFLPQAYSAVYYNVIDYITIATTGNATDFGDLLNGDNYAFMASACSSTRGVYAGGSASGGQITLNINIIQYITIATTGNSTDFGDLTVGRAALAGVSSSTRGVYAGGVTSSAESNVIDYITIATTGNATDFGDLLSTTLNIGGGVSSGTRGVYAGGAASNSIQNVIQYITIATTGNATDFGDLTLSRQRTIGSCSTTRGVFAGGDNVSTYYNNIDYITIATTGNATDFGDLLGVASAMGGTSDVGGWLS